MQSKNSISAKKYLKFVPSALSLKKEIYLIVKSLLKWIKLSKFVHLAPPSKIILN